MSFPVIKDQKKMQHCLASLGIPLTVSWTPDLSKNVHGELKGIKLFIYDENPQDAWSTFTHEVAEYRLQSVTRPYRLLINALIETFEKIEYAEKEQFVEFLPRIIQVIKQTQGEKYEMEVSEKKENKA